MAGSLSESQQRQETRDLVDWIKANGMVGLPLEMLARRELEGPHGPGCMCDEVEKTDDACTFVTSAARTKEGK